MPADQIFRLRNPVLLAALAAAFPVISYAAEAANINFTSGSVMAVNAVGIQRPLTKGAEIGNGDTIRTGDGGRAQIRFSDGAMISLQPKTEFRVDSYQYSGKTDGQEKGFFSLLKGGFRAITGWVGRSNRENYKVTTSVATIGIRGTEYSAKLNDTVGELVVNTGEGLVEVCNGAGCMLLASGESGIVSGAKAPSRTDSRPQLPPASPSDTSEPIFSKSSDVGPAGLVLPVSAPLQSGTGYYVGWVGAKGATPSIGLETPAGGAAVFDTASIMTSFSDSFSAPYAASSIKGGFAMDGVIGWGAWATGTYSSSTALKDFHYVAGMPTPAGDLTALGGVTATYTLAGFTTPTTTTGLTGGTPTAVFTATFGGAGALSLNLSVPVTGTVYSDTLSGTFSGASINLTSACSSANGFFAGANASHAGMTYKMDGGSMYIMGALAFKR
ncbi:FecR family protein [Propionivibrio sp.]|uniref:FecR family protein n=1 Tax=Propionivibrio sp. TaxID=2212460 RepID=UPI0025E90E63|nr:FecR family protein [Propionivibrio sp.]MBK8743841.1 FecR domain-containing protein [Propionivibrio sp.]